MKYFLTLLLALTSGNVFASNSNFLTEEQFKSLSREDKAHYIRAVQRILATMSKQTLFMAEVEAPDNSRMPAASLLTEPSAPQDKKDITYLLVNKLKQEQELEQQHKALAARDDFDFSDPKKTSSIPEKKADSVVAKTSTLVASSPSPVPTPEPAPAPAPAPAPTPAPAPINKAPASTPTPEKKPVAKATEVIKETKKEAAQDKEVKSRENYRCMYAGWVVTKNPCTGVNKLPTGWEIDGTDARSRVR